MNYVSVNSKPDHPPIANPRKIFFERANSLSPGNKESAKSLPHLGQKNLGNSSSRGNYFQNSSKKTQKNETEVMKNSTEMLICLEILKQWNIEAQSFLVSDVYGYPKYIKSFFIRLNCQKIQTKFFCPFLGWL